MKTRTHTAHFLADHNNSIVTVSRIAYQICLTSYERTQLLNSWKRLFTSILRPISRPGFWRLIAVTDPTTASTSTVITACGIVACNRAGFLTEDQDGRPIVQLASRSLPRQVLLLCFQRQNLSQSRCWENVLHGRHRLFHYYRIFYF
jgi:hypothetical protein